MDPVPARCVRRHADQVGERLQPRERPDREQYALYLIAAHRQWFDRPGWGIALICAGLLVLAAGFVLDLDRRARRRRS